MSYPERARSRAAAKHRPWLIALGLIPLWWLSTWFVLAVVASMTQGECYEPTSMTRLEWARALLTMAALAMPIPWLVAAVCLRWPALVALGLLASGLAIYWAVTVWTMSPADWTNYNLC